MKTSKRSLHMLGHITLKLDLGSRAVNMFSGTAGILMGCYLGFLRQQIVLNFTGSLTDTKNPIAFTFSYGMFVCLFQHPEEISLPECVAIMILVHKHPPCAKLTLKSLMQSFSGLRSFPLSLYPHNMRLQGKDVLVDAFNLGAIKEIVPRQRFKYCITVLDGITCEVNATDFKQGRLVGVVEADQVINREDRIGVVLRLQAAEKFLVPWSIRTTRNRIGGSRFSLDR
ncbi:hypothetical protein AK812_SmicGene7865 [Symbiodinium microadriaticum]|uniref:Uncharacterized protein n=1 Tax=Symbiodinium microadriaticum TaxID=2951 RepID=A0A1Q9EME9_SYMMI|nr:hypothetical protein AK812_SmicGene7865 [Symbiodinium microadriaticum]